MAYTLSDLSDYPDSSTVSTYGRVSSYKVSFVDYSPTHSNLARTALSSANDNSTIDIIKNSFQTVKAAEFRQEAGFIIFFDGKGSVAAFQASSVKSIIREDHVS